MNESKTELLGPDYSAQCALQDKPEIPVFANRQGAQQVVDEGRKLNKRYEDLKCSTDNIVAKAQELLCQVEDYEAALSNFNEWLGKEIETVNLITSFACTNEDINAELTKIQV